MFAKIQLIQTDINVVTDGFTKKNCFEIKRLFIKVNDTLSKKLNNICDILESKERAGER